MALKVGIKIDLDRSEAIQGASEVRRAIAGIGDGAQAAAAAAQPSFAGVAAAAAAIEPPAEAAAAAVGDVGAAARRTTGETKAAGDAMKRMATDAAAAATASAAAAQRAAAAWAGIRDAAPGRGEDIAAYGRALDDLRARFVPLAALGRRYRQELRDIADAERVGAITATEAATARERLKAAFATRVTTFTGADAHAEAARTAEIRRRAREQLQGLQGLTSAQAQAEGRSLNFGVLGAYSATRPSSTPRREAIRLTAQEKFQVGQQAQDFVSQIIAGGNPLVAGIQQGSQLTSVLGGTGRALAFVRSLITPVTAGIATLGAAVVTAGIAWKGYLDSTKAVEVVLAGLGRNAGTTAADLEAQTAGIAAAAGLSRKETRALEAQLLGTGKIGAASIGDVAKVVKDFGATIGADTTQAGQILSDLVAKPAEGARRLSQELGLLDGSTARHIQRLVAENRETEARNVLLAALPGRLADAELATTGLERVWRSFARTVSDVLDGVGKTIDRIVDGSSIQDQIAAIDAAISMLRGQSGLSDSSPQVQGLLRQRDVLEGIVNLERERAELTRREDEDKRKGDRAVGVAQQSPANADSERIRDLRIRQSALREGLRSPTLSGEERKQIVDAIDAITRALSDQSTAQERASALADLDRRIAEARDPVRRADLVARREALELSRQEITTGQAAAEVEIARTRALAESLSAARNQTADLRERADVARAVADAIAGGEAPDVASGRLSQELQLLPLVRGALAAEGRIREGLTEAIRQQRAAAAELDAETRRGQALQAISQQGDDLARIRLEIGLVGESDAVRRRALATMEAEQEIRRRGWVGREAEDYRRNAAAIAEATAELERQRAAWSEVQRTGGDAIDRLTQALGDGDWGSAFEEVLAGIQKEMLQLTVANPLKNLLLGTNLPTGVDVLDRLSGRGADAVSDVVDRTTGTMTVTAQTVVLSGLGGLPGLKPPGDLGTQGREIGSTAATNTRIADRVAGAWDRFPAAGSYDLAQRLAAGKTEASISGMDPGFRASLEAAFAAAPASVRDATTITSGYRSTARQEELWQAALAKYGSPEIARRWVAPPGRSAHNAGLAADLSFGTSEARQWWHDQAGGFGLRFPMSWEPWHIQGSKAGARASTASGVDTGAAERALQQLADRTAVATTGLDKMSTGLGDVTADLTGSARTIGSATGRLGRATESMAADTTTALSTLGEGLVAGIQSVLGSIGSLAGAMIGGRSGSAWGGVINFGAQLLLALFGGGGATSSVPIPTPNPLGSFDVGGYTGDGARLEPAGVVHRGEFVFDAASTRRIGVSTLEAIRSSRRLPGYASGGYVGPTTAPATRAIGGGDSRPFSIAIINNGQPMQPRGAEEKDDGRGGRRLEITLDQMVADSMDRGPATRGALARRGAGVGVIRP